MADITTFKCRAPFTPAEIQALPSRLYTSEVVRLARYSVTTLWRKRRRGEMPAPIDQGEEAIFDRDAVLKALGMIHDAAPPAADPDDDPWSVNPDAIRQARTGNVRHAASPKGRNRAGVLPGPSKAPALRLVAADPPADRG